MSVQNLSMQSRHSLFCDDLQIDQSVEPTRVTIAGSAQSLQLALCMVRDIVAGNFKVLADSHGRAGRRACSQTGNAACHNSL